MDKMSEEKMLQSSDNVCDEQLMNSSYKHIFNLTYNDIWGLEFGSEEEAVKFYLMYARMKGFFGRKDEVVRDSMGGIIMRQMVCNREGSRHKKHCSRLDRQRSPRPNMRTKCGAKFRVNFDYKSCKWKVADFVDCHNHELTPCDRVHLIPGYRKLSDGDKAQVDSLHLHGVQTSHIYGLIVGQKGGQSNVGFCKKDLYNHIDRNKRVQIEDGDAFAALCYLQSKADNDEMYYSKFTTCSDGRLEHLFWTDGGSRVDYECFGDVVAFDTTYKKNKYNRPLVIFCGYNHHGETVIFGFALVADETAETYKWLLQTFSEAMFHKDPKGIVTDGDHAMREAVQSVFPNSCHRLCAWHIQKNAAENVRNKKFLGDFKHLIYSNYSPEEFEEEWKSIIEKYGLNDNKWMKKMYKVKKMWASSYLRDYFFAGFRTTSICEGINSFIKRYVKNRSSLFDLMHNLERAVKQYRHNELISDFNSSYFIPLMTNALFMYEEAACKIYTLKKYKEVKEEIDAATRIIVEHRIESENDVKLIMNVFGRPNKDYTVWFFKKRFTFECECKFFESRGIPCRHIFCAMKQMHIDSIPSSLICKRWTKSAKVDYMSFKCTNEVDVDKEKSVMLRKGAMSGLCNRLVELVAADDTEFVHAVDDVVGLISKYGKKNGDVGNNTNSFSIGDPILVKTKGAPRKKNKNGKRKRCGNCRKTGHTIRRCPRFLSANEVLETVNEGDTSADDDDVDEVIKKGKVSKVFSDGPFPSVSGGYMKFENNDIIPTQSSAKINVIENVREDVGGDVGGVVVGRNLNSNFTSLLENLQRLGNLASNQRSMHSTGSVNM